MKSAWIRAAVIALAGLGAFALAGSFPEEPRFQAPVNLKVSESQVKAGQTLPLDVVLEALARSVGLQPLIYRAYDPSGDPAKAQPPLPNIKLDFQGKPFREVWDLLFATYGNQYSLDYLFLPPDVVVVAPTQVITALVDAPSRTGAMERRTARRASPLATKIWMCLADSATSAGELRKFGSGRSDRFQSQT